MSGRKQPVPAVIICRLRGGRWIIFFEWNDMVFKGDGRGMGMGGVVIRRRQLLKGELLDMDCLLTANEGDHKYITET